MLLLLAAVGAGCLGPSEAADRPVVHARPVDLEGRDSRSAPGVGRLRLLAGFALTSSDARFGGLSGLWLAPDGDAMLAVSDRGTLWRAELRHDASGRLVGVRGWQPLVLARPAIGATMPRSWPTTGRAASLWRTKGRTACAASSSTISRARLPLCRCQTRSRAIAATPAWRRWSGWRTDRFWH
jgi:hypothetical protein